MNAYKYTRILIPLSLILAIAIGLFNEPGADWLMYMRAAILYRNKYPLYALPIKQYGGTTMYFFYSPVSAFLMSPVSMLPFFLTMLAWCALKLFLLYRVANIMAGKIGFNSLAENKKALVFLISYLFSLRFLLYDFDLGQITVFLLWTMIEGWYQVKKGNNVAGALLLSIGLFIKTLSLVFIPYLIYKKKFKSLGLLLCWIVVLALSPFLSGYWSYNLSMYKDWLHAINPIDTDNSFKTDVYSLTVLHDLHIAIPAWYAAIAHSLHSIIQFNDLTGAQLNIVLYGSIACLIFAFLFLPGTIPFADSCDEKTELAELCYILGVIPLIFPRQQKYSFVLLIPLIIYISYSLFSKRVKLFPLILVFISFTLMVLSTDGIIGRPLNIITQQLKFVTIGAIILLSLLFIIGRNEKAQVTEL